MKSFGAAILGYLCILTQFGYAVPTREWTVFIYSAGDEGTAERGNEFSRAAVRMLKSFEKIRIPQGTDDTAFVVQYDASGDDADGVTNNREWRRRLTYHPNGDALGSEGVRERDIRTIDPTFRYVEPDSGDPVTLKKFLSWGIQAYPAKNYFLIIQAHSWGWEGLAQDFNFNGRNHRTSSMIKNYELRRVFEEIYREDAARGRDRLIAKGKFDGILIDACTSGQLEILLELKDVFRYFVGTSLEVPYNSFPYTTIFEPFVAEVSRRARANQDTGSAEVIERHLLSPMVTQYVREHSPGGTLARLERQTDIVDAFAIRNDQLDRVRRAFTEFVRRFPNTARTQLREQRPASVWNIRDTDEDTDLLSLARAYRAYFAEAHTRTQAQVWNTAATAAQNLETSLDYPAPNPSLDFTRVHHATAAGAWIHTELDTISPNRELPACNGLKVFAMANSLETTLLPTLLPRGRHTKTLHRTSCNDELDALQAQPGPVEAGVPVRLERVLGWRVSWPHNVPAYLTETRALNGTVQSRRLSFWIAKPRNGALDVRLRLHFAASTQTTIDYVSRSPEDYIRRNEGFLALRAGGETIRYNAVVDDQQHFGQGLYVAEAHTNGAHFKHGFGILLTKDFNSDEPYQSGRVPLKVLEDALEQAEFSIPLSLYAENWANYRRQLQRRNINPRPTGAEFYGLHRIQETGWPGLLAGDRQPGAAQRDFRHRRRLGVNVNIPLAD